MSHIHESDWRNVKTSNVDSASLKSQSIELPVSSLQQHIQKRNYRNSDRNEASNRVTILVACDIQ